MAEQRDDVGQRTASAQNRLMADLQRATLGDYEVLAELGRGGMAAVFLAHDLALDRKVAIKVMYPQLFAAEGSVERFKREARTAASLNHPNIIPIYAVHDREDLLYFVMQFVAGRTLDSISDELGQVSLGLIQTIVAEVGNALGYAHRRGVIHRDVKPGNILLDDEGRTLVADFGIAKVATADDLTRTGGIVGTPAYMSPEQSRGGELSGASDQYSLGAVAYTLLTGRPPFSGDNALAVIFQHANAEPTPIRELREDCPPAIAETVHRMLAKKPEDRWPSVEDAVQALGSAAPANQPEIRSRLGTLALTGNSRVLLNQLRTPTSPVPPAKPMRRSAEGLATPGPAPSPPRRALHLTRFAWAVPAAALGVAAWIAWPRSDDSMEGGPTEGGTEPPAVAAEPAVGLIEIAEVPRLEVGQTRLLTATAFDESGATVDAPVRWSSRNPAVVRVSENGVVTAVDVGRSSVLAQAGGATATVAVEVSQSAEPRPPVPPPAPDPRVAQIMVSPRAGSISVGGRLELQAAAQDARGNALAGRRVAWASSDRALATVSATGVVTGVAPGSVRITASVGDVTEVAVVDITPVPLVALVVSPASPELETGRSLQLRATNRNARGQLLPAGQVTWRSTNPSVVTVSPSGRVTAVSEGSATISAESAGNTATVTVKVATPDLPVETPSPVRDRERITAILNAFARAIESRDIAALRRAYPAMTGEEEANYLETFGALERLQDFQVQLDLAQPFSITDGRAQARGHLIYAYRDRGAQTIPTPFTATLERAAQDWRLLAIQLGQ